MYSSPWKINNPLSDFTTKVLKMYLKFPEGQSFTAMDWNARDGHFLNSLTKEQDNRLLYGISEDNSDVYDMRETYNFEKVYQAHYRSEAKITNDAFSMMVVNPDVDERIIDEIFNQIDPYNMPNFEEEVRAKVMRDEEERQYLQEQIANQIDFGELNEDNTKKEETETMEERQERINKKIHKELEKRIKAWRLAMKEQQKKLANMRWDAFLLQRATTYLRPAGILVMITPKELIDDSITFKLVNQYEDIKILRLDNDEYEEYRKCIIIAKKREKPTREEYTLGKALARTKERPYKTFGEIRQPTVTPGHEKYDAQVFRMKVDAMYGVIEPQVEPTYKVPVCDAEEIALFRVGPVTGTEALHTLKKSKLINSYQEKYSQIFSNKEPVTPSPLHKGHIMLLLTSGFLNGYIGTGPDQHLVKGSAVKDIREFTETDDDGDTRIVEREYYNIGVKLLDAKGEFKKIM